MSKIDYQALREAAKRAIPAMERLLMLPADDDLLSEQELKDYGVDIDALNAFKFMAGPETVLTLLYETDATEHAFIAACKRFYYWKERAEAAENRIAELESALNRHYELPDVYDMAIKQFESLAKSE